MRIMLCNKFYRPVGGPETIVFDTQARLESLGHTIIPFAMAHKDNRPSSYSGYFVPCVDYNDQARKPLWHLIREAMDLIYSRESMRRADRLIADAKPDVAHAHNIYHQLSPSVLVALKRAGIPTVLTLHDGKLLCANMSFYTNGRVCVECGGRRFHRAVTHRCVKGSAVSSLVCCVEETIHRWLSIYERNVDLMISPSRFLRDMLIECGRIDADKIVVLPNYADTSSTQPDYSPGDYGLFVGKLEEFKGIRTLLAASRRNPDFKMRIAGRGPLYDEGIRICEAERMDNVSFVGFQTGQALTELRRGCRFVVVPSEWYENCPMVILEAYAAGKPVVASRIGGIPELVDDGIDGLLYEPGNADELSACMRRLIEDPKLASAMGRAARAKVETRYSIECHVDALMDIYVRISKA